METSILKIFYNHSKTKWTRFFFLWQTNDALGARYFLYLDLWKDSTNQKTSMHMKFKFYLKVKEPNVIMTINKIPAHWILPLDLLSTWKFTFIKKDLVSTAPLGKWPYTHIKINLQFLCRISSKMFYHFERLTIHQWLRLQSSQKSCLSVNSEMHI